MTRYSVEILNNKKEIDIILGNNKHILRGYDRNNIKLVGGWYYKRIQENRDFILSIIKKHGIMKINFIGASKTCSGCIVLAKQLLSHTKRAEINLFMFSAYTTVDKNVYLKRNLAEKAPGTLKKFWLSPEYTPEMIKRMEARHLANRERINMYFFYPERCKLGEKALAHRIKGKNVTYFGMPVFLHNTLFPLWKEVNSDMTIEIYEEEYRTMHKDDFIFYFKLQNYKDYNFHLYSCLKNPALFKQELDKFKKNISAGVI